MNTLTRPVLTGVLVPPNVESPLGVLEHIMGSFGSLSEGWSLGGPWKGALGKFYHLMTPSLWKDLRKFTTNPDEDADAEVLIQLAQNSLPVKPLLGVDWAPHAIVNPAGKMLWSEWEKREGWGKKVAAWFDRFPDCYLVVVNMMLPDEDYRSSVEPKVLVQKKTPIKSKRKPNAKPKSARPSSLSL